MKFPDDARTILYYREAVPHPRIPNRMTPAGPERSYIFQNSEYTTTWEEHGFSLRWNPAEDTERGGKTSGELRPLLRRLDGAGDVFLERLELVVERGQLASISLDPDIPVNTRYRIFQHGYQSWTMSTMRTHEEADEFARPAWKHRMDENPETPHQSALPVNLPLHMFPAKGKFHADNLIGLEEQIEAEREDVQTSPTRILVYAWGQGGQFIRFRTHLDKHSGRMTEFAVIWDMNGRRFTQHSRESLTPVAWNFEFPGEKSRRRTFAGMLNEAGHRIAGNMLRKRPKSPGIVGWCSWYYYYTKITEDIILDNLSSLSRSKLKVDLFQIDDGYQRSIGDWTHTNDKFPGGMQFLASEIKKTGMRAGLWLAPTIVTKDSQLLQSHPGIVLRHERSNRPVSMLYNPLWGGRAYGLDVTHPVYKEWLSETIHTLVHHWGYDYLKLDFLFTAAHRGRWHDDTSSGARRLRETLQLVRKVAGRKVMLLGCGCPLWPAAGVLDAMRIGMDVNHIWGGDTMSWLLRDRNYPTTRAALINTINRSFLHNRFWVNDPDCLMVRGRDTKLTLKQVYLMASVMSVSGGMLLLSDDLTKLEEDRFDIFTLAAEINRKCAGHTPIPLGMMEHQFPRGLYNPAGYIGVWNPTRRPDRVTVPLPAGLDEAALRGAKDVWTGGSISWQIEDGRLHLAMAPFESVVAKV